MRVRDRERSQSFLPPFAKPGWLCLLLMSWLLSCSLACSCYFLSGICWPFLPYVPSQPGCNSWGLQRWLACLLGVPNSTHSLVNSPLTNFSSVTSLEYDYFLLGPRKHMNNVPQSWAAYLEWTMPTFLGTATVKEKREKWSEWAGLYVDTLNFAPLSPDPGSKLWVRVWRPVPLTSCGIKLPEPHFLFMNRRYDYVPLWGMWWEFIRDIYEKAPIY